MEVSVFVPSHITGFFSIHEDKNLLKKGSCGGGVLIDKGVNTTIKIIKKDSNDLNKENDESYNSYKSSKNPKNSPNITINGQKDLKNETITKKTIEIMKKEFPLELKDEIINKITINHEIQVPIGSGFGTSAACAVGTAIGLSKLLKLPISQTKAAQFAHIAEVSLGSGLGDVLSQTSKGIVIRKYPGAPGIGKVENITRDNNTNFSDFSEFCVITKTFGEIDTSSIIQDNKQIKNINEIGIAMQKEIIANPTLENFMKCSYEFSTKTGLMNDELKNLVEELKKETIGASMAMLGNTIFAIIKKENIKNIKNLDQFTISKIYTDGIKITAK